MYDKDFSEYKAEMIKRGELTNSKRTSGKASQAPYLTHP